MKIIATVSFFTILGIGGLYYWYQYDLHPRVIREDATEIAYNCTDSDGENIYTKGKVEYYNELSSDGVGQSKGGMEDVCDFYDKAGRDGAGIVRESTCTTNNRVKNIYSTCGRGYVCRAGACIKGEKTASLCTDSDGGKNAKERGETQVGGTAVDECWVGDPVTKEGPFTDKCQGSNCYVYEYYCDGNSREYTLISAVRGCLDGVSL